MNISGVIRKGPRVDQPKYPSTNGTSTVRYVRTMRYIHTMEYYLALKRNEALELPRRPERWWIRKESTCQSKRRGFDSWAEKIPHAVEQLSLCATITEPVLQSPGAAAAEPTWPRTHAPQQKKPSHHD